MGLDHDEAQRVTQRFRSHNTALIERMYPYHGNREKFIAVARQGRQQLVEQMAKERQEQQAPPPS
jgi:glutathione-regulated potassium-efflux system ancillary protein KefC